MSKEKPLAIRSILSACLSSWAHSPRTLVLLIFIVMLGISEADIAITNFTNQQLQLSSGDVLYYHLAKGFNTIMSSAMFLIMADELPRKISFQNYLLIRTNRVKWLFAQIFMCFILALLMLVLCCVTVFLASLTHVSSDWQWSDCQFVQQGFLMNDQDGITPAIIRNQFSPLHATFVAMVPLFFFWVSMLLIILLFGIYGKSIVGLTICMTTLLSSWILMTLFTDWTLPVYFATINGILTMDPSLAHYKEIIFGYCTFDAILIVAMVLRLRREDLSF